MNFDPGRGAFQPERTDPSDPRTALVRDAAEMLFGIGWRFKLSAEFAVSVDEIDDWMADRFAVPDFVVAGLMRMARISQGAYSAVAAALPEAADAPFGDYSEPGAALRNGRILIRDRSDGLPDGYEYGPDGDVVPVEDLHDPQYLPDGGHSISQAPHGHADAAPDRPALYVVGSARDGGYREPVIDARDRI
jgi:hypothetical protein